MSKLPIALAVMGVLLTAGTARADFSCGPGCHEAPQGECVVNGWETGAHVRNVCPVGVGAQPQPPCGSGYRWSRIDRACVIR